MYWVRKILADLVDHSIYRIYQWWRPIWREHAGGRRGGKVTSASVIVALTVAKPPAMDGLTTTVHCDVLKLLGTWRKDGKRPTPVRIISAGHRQSGYGELSSDLVRAYLGTKIFYSPRLSTLRRARIRTPARIAAKFTDGAIHYI